MLIAPTMFFGSICALCRSPPASYQDVLDFAYYSGWRRNEILEFTWDQVDLGSGVIRLPARRSTTKTGRMLPILAPLRQVLDRWTRARCAGDRRVFRRLAAHLADEQPKHVRDAA